MPHPSLARRLTALVAAVFLLLLSRPATSAAPGATAIPAQPRSGQAVRIDAGVAASGEPAPSLEFQVVPPGRYIARADPRYRSDWKSVAMARDGSGHWSAEIPGTFNAHRTLVRYRIRSASDGRQLLPPKEDSQGNYAYFVHDGVPAWRGAVNPRGDAAARTVVEYPSAALTRVPVYHLVAGRRDVETAQWSPQDGRVRDPRRDYGATGTLVCDGVVYDHVGFRARGGMWRHAMGKNMWKFNFNPGHRLAAKDDHGRPYAAKWDKLNLGACIQQGDYGMRGEQGLFEATTFRLFNLAGVPAPRTHWIHLRVVTDAEESPANQYQGDFWGLYLATENVDGGFLKEHGLSPGNLYKVEGYAPDVHHRADGSKDDATDARQFLGALLQGGGRPRRGDPANWWDENLDLPAYYGYRAVLEAVHHYDIADGKNYFLYHDLSTGRWQFVPWDVDLSWGEHMYGTGHEPVFRAGLLREGAHRAAYQDRLAELRDLLLNPEAIGRVIDEHASLIWDGPGRPSLADADRAKWDHHPVMSSGRVSPGKSEPGLFYLRNPANHLDVMVDLMKRFASGRQRHLDQLLAGHNPPARPTVVAPETVDAGEPSFAVTVRTGDGSMPGVVRWRLAESTRPGEPGFEAGKPWRHEVEALWQGETSGKPRVQVPCEGLQPGHAYRVRTRVQSADGRWSRWSEPAVVRVRAGKP